MAKDARFADVDHAADKQQRSQGRRHVAQHDAAKHAAKLHMPPLAR
jgi:hypothetical protein